MPTQFIPLSSRPGLPIFIRIGLLVLLLNACSSTAKFIEKSPLTLTPSNDASAVLQVSGWSDSQSLTLMNGGPYLENSISFSIASKLLASIDGYIASVDVNNDLHIIDFTITPARQIMSVPLENDVTSITAHHKRLFVGIKDSGVVKLTVSAETRSVKKQKISPAPDVSKIKIHNEVLYFLSGNRKIFGYSLNPEVSASSQPHTWKLPAETSDFAITEDGFILLTKFGLDIVDFSKSESVISTRRLQGTKQQITVQNSIALVADGSGGMVLFDIQDRKNPRWLGSHNKLGSIQKILAEKNKAFVIDRGVRIASVNISNVELPITGSFYKPEENIQDMLLVDGAVFIATSSGIEKVIFPKDTHGQISNEGINQGGTRRAFISDDLAYVADWFSGLHIYDISTPAAPRHIGNFHTPGSSKGVVVENGYAYVGDDDHGLQIIDIKNPRKPFITGNVLTTGLAYTLKKRGELIFLADHRGGFHIINVADVSNPFIVSSHNTTGKSWALDLMGDFLFVADDDSGLLVFNISNLKQPKQVGKFSPGGYAEDVIVRNNIAYVSFFDKGLYLIDVSAPNSPALISHIDIPGNARSVVLKEQYAYIAGWESGLQVVDISDSRAPKIVGSFDTSGSAWGADIYSNQAYVWDWWGGVKVIDVSSPSDPKFTAQYHASSTINKLRQKNNFIYTANDTNGVQVFDINNALNPIWTTGVDTEGNVVDVWPSQQSSTLFAISDRTGLMTFDISDPFYIRLLGNYKIDGTPKIVREYNRRVYVATKNGTLQIFNADDTNKLILTQKIDVDAQDVWVDRQTLFIASPAEGLVTFPIDAKGRVVAKKQIVSESANKIVANEKYLIVATDSHEINVWDRRIEGIALNNTFNIDDSVLALALDNEMLLVLSKNRGVLQYELNANNPPRLVARYPLTDNYNDMLLHGNAIFFAGQHTIASVQILPKLVWKTIDATKLKINANGKLPLGNYHLSITDTNNAENFWPNALSVKLKQSGKPKLSNEDFQQLLEQHRKNQ